MRSIGLPAFCLSHRQLAAHSDLWRSGIFAFCFSHRDRAVTEVERLP
jgi:hypothetical protein